MEHVKTAVSVRRNLFDRAESLARRLKVSRSRLYSLALEEFLERDASEELLKSYNEAYADGLEDAERAWLRAVRRHHRQLVEGEW